MYVPLAQKLYLSTTGSAATAYSPAAAIDPFGSIEAQSTLISLSLPGIALLEVHIEKSNDLENWVEHDPATFISLGSSPSFGSIALSNLAACYVRLRFFLNLIDIGTVTCVCTGGIEIHTTIPMK